MDNRMTFPQYRRLLLILLLPLLIAGWWLAAHETLFDRAHLTECSRHQGQYLCIDTRMTKAAFADRKYRSGGVWLTPNSRLFDGFKADVITFPIPTMGEEGITASEPSQSTPKRLVIASNRGAQFNPEGSCDLGSHASNAEPGKLWTLMCGSALVEQFRFSAANDEVVYLEAVSKAREIDDKQQRISAMLSALAVAIPLLGFLALSMLAWGAMKAAKFVKG